MDDKADVGMEIKMNNKCFPDIVKLDEGVRIDEAQIHDLIAFVEMRHDCADFRVLPLIKTLYAYRHLVSEDTKAAIKKALLGFKYWMDEPGVDGMCYWSENHQLIFHTAEYLVGQMFPEDIFTNNNETGASHVRKALPKIEAWLENRFRFGFIEWHSNTYFEEDIAPLALLSDYAGDAAIAKRARIILDLLMLDFALNSHFGYFAVTSGRCYEKQKLDPDMADVNDILAWAFGILKQEPDYTRLGSLLFLTGSYQVPETIRRIARDGNTSLVKESHGLDLEEVKAKIKIHDFDHLGMYYWAMEAFTNKESINMTMDIFNRWHLASNNFLRDLKMVNIKLLRKLGLLPLVVKILNLATQGVAIQRANTYTYKTQGYMLSSIEKYHPGEFGDQQHIWQALLPGKLPLFSTHPGSPMFDDPARNFSPSYWVGNGINPDCRQYENSLLLYYDLGVRKGFLERKRQMYVHFYFPEELYDEVVYSQHAVYMRKQDTYVAIHANATARRTGEELVYDGKRLGFAITLDMKSEAGSFAGFMADNPPDAFRVRGKRLTYSGKRTLELEYKGDFKTDGIRQDPNHHRYDTGYVHARREPEEILIECGGYQLRLNYGKMIREETKGDNYAEK